MLPEGWAGRPDHSGEWDVYVTEPVPVAEMHAQMANIKSAFFAGIRRI